MEYTLARHGAERLWKMLNRGLCPCAGRGDRQSGSPTGGRGIEIDLRQRLAGGRRRQSGRPDVSRSKSVSGQQRSLAGAPINHALQRADQISMLEEQPEPIDWFAPMVADAEAGFGGPLNSFEIMREMIDAGAAGVHFEDQLASAKKCGHMGGKVLVPMQEFITKLIAARLAADVCGVPTVLCARTDADGATLLTSDIDPRDHQFLTGERTEEGFFRIQGGLHCAIARGLAYAPYCDMIWCETSHPNMDEARKFAEGIARSSP